VRSEEPHGEVGLGGRVPNTQTGFRSCVPF
jgi:hypothetical protein